jgi:hypothetical protein
VRQNFRNLPRIPGYFQRFPAWGKQLQNGWFFFFFRRLGFLRLVTMWHFAISLAAFCWQSGMGPMGGRISCFRAVVPEWWPVSQSRIFLGGAGEDDRSTLGGSTKVRRKFTRWSGDLRYSPPLSLYIPPGTEPRSSELAILTASRVSTMGSTQSKWNKECQKLISKLLTSRSSSSFVFRRFLGDPVLFSFCF